LAIILNSPGNTKSRWLISGLLLTQVYWCLTDKNLDSWCEDFRFIKIIEGKGNMIAGDSKKLIFHPDQIFSDDNALYL
jgi:hypothetical protein